MFFRTKRSGPREYVQIVENVREGSRVRQAVLATLGRLDSLRESGQLDSLLESGARLSESAVLISALREGQVTSVRNRRIGPSLVFERLWKETGCRAVLKEASGERGFGFSIERAVFTTVLHRLMQSGSDRSALAWRDDYAIDGSDDLQLQHLYRAMAFLGEPLPSEEQDSPPCFGMRCVKDTIEERLFTERQDLFSSLDLVFFDTTSLFFYGQGGDSLGRRGHSKDHRPELHQVVVGAVLDGEGRPICSEIWPGNTADVTTLLPVVGRFQKRFGVDRVCIVTDRGMMSAETLAELEGHGVGYIVGARMRAQKEVDEEVLSRAGRYQVVHPERKGPEDPSPLEVKEVLVGTHRYVICYNEEQARRDCRDREEILKTLAEKLRQGPRALVGNRGFRKFVRGAGGRYEIDVEAVRREERYDGTWVLRTNLEFSAAEIALKYKQLWMVEDLFRSIKSLLNTRPIFHKRDETIRGHVFCSFLALILRKELLDRLSANGLKPEWAAMLADLDALQLDELEKNERRYQIRTDLRGSAGAVLQALGIAVPARFKRLDSVPSPPATPIESVSGAQS